ncbi:MAG: hypothetical protein JW862_10030, partial [Anaerolineales bacterium]|nr:hypothetical protein [Anaerolineales bacterium]
ITPDGSHLYAASNAGGLLFALETGTGRMDGLIPVGPGNWQRAGWQVEVFPAAAGPYAYVTAPGAGQVTAVNIRSNAVVATMPVGGGPRGLALFPPEAACLSGAVLLEPAQAYEYGQAGDTLVFTSTVVNLTGTAGSFNLGLSGDTWAASLSLNNTGSLAHMEEISFTVEVEIPAGAVWGDYDEIILAATSSSNPGLYADISHLTAAVPRPGYVFAKVENRIHIVDTQFHQHTGVVIDASAYGNEIWRGALSPDGSWLYASYQNSPLVLVVDTATQQPLTTVAVGSRPHGIVFSADGAYAFVANRDSASVSIIDTGTHTVADTLAVGDGPTSLAYVPCLDKIYVGNEWDGSISVIDTALMTVTSVITGFDDPRAVVASPYGKYVYVANAGDSTIAVIDTATDAWIATWEVEGALWLASLDVSPVGHRLYAADSENGYVYVLDSTTGVVLSSFMIGTGEEWEQAWELELFPAGLGPFAYVTVPEANVLRVFNAVTNTLIGTIYGGDGPRGLRLFPQETICGSELCLPLLMRNAP